LANALAIKKSIFLCGADEADQLIVYPGAFGVLDQKPLPGDKFNKERLKWFAARETAEGPLKIFESHDADPILMKQFNAAAFVLVPRKMPELHWLRNQLSHRFR
jgi:hypothetical protein